MMRMKYIVYDNGLFDAPIIFPECMDHSTIVFQLGLDNSQLISAGYVQFNNGLVDCYGQSQSLEISSSLNDSDIINTMLGHHEFLPKEVA